MTVIRVSIDKKIPSIHPEELFLETKNRATSKSFTLKNKPWYLWISTCCHSSSTHSFLMGSKGGYLLFLSPMELNGTPIIVPSLKKASRKMAGFFVMALPCMHEWQMQIIANSRCSEVVSQLYRTTSRSKGTRIEPQKKPTNPVQPLEWEKRWETYKTSGQGPATWCEKNTFNRHGNENSCRDSKFLLNFEEVAGKWSRVEGGTCWISSFFEASNMKRSKHLP